MRCRPHSEGCDWVLEASEYYLTEMQKFQLVTDHHPLLELLKKDLWDTSPQPQHILERVAAYSRAIVSFCYSNRHLLAETLGRYPVFDATDPWMDHEQFYTYRRIANEVGNETGND